MSHDTTPTETETETETQDDAVERFVDAEGRLWLRLWQPFAEGVLQLQWVRQAATPT